MGIVTALLIVVVGLIPDATLDRITQILGWLLSHMGVAGVMLAGATLAGVILLEEFGGETDQHVLKLHGSHPPLRGGRLTAITVSVCRNVIPAAPQSVICAELAATSTGRTQRDLGAGVSSVLLAVCLHVTEARAAAVPAAVSGGIVPTVGRHLPAPSGEPIWGVSGYRVPSGTPPPSDLARTTRRVVIRRGCSMWVLLPREPSHPP